MTMARVDLGRLFHVQRSAGLGIFVRVSFTPSGISWGVNSEKPTKLDKVDLEVRSL